MGSRLNWQGASRRLWTGIDPSTTAAATRPARHLTRYPPSKHSPLHYFMFRKTYFLFHLNFGVRYLLKETIKNDAYEHLLVINNKFV